MISVEIICATSRPMDVISLAAGASRGKRDVSSKRVENCYKQGHLSVFENAAFTVRISGISRDCSHQLVRYRHASFCQESQRYKAVDTSGEWTVRPDFFNDYTDWWDRIMRFIAAAYEGAISRGAHWEDARYLLPGATKTSLIMTMNIREFYHFLNQRLKADAQWEIRELAHVIMNELRLYDRQWGELLDLRDRFLLLPSSSNEGYHD